MKNPKQNLVLLPGLCFDGEVWENQIQSLQDIANCQVITLGNPKSLEGLLSDILKQTPEKFALAGHSMGGWVALELMNRVPDRITKLALIQTRCTAFSAEEKIQKLKVIERAQNGMFEDVAREFCKMIVQPSSMDSDLGRKVHSIILQVGSAKFIDQYRVLIERKSGLDQLSHIECPTLVVASKEDATTPLDENKKIAERIPASKFVVLKNCSHMATLDQPKNVSEEMRKWLLA